MNIVERKISELIPYGNNAKIHMQRQIDQIAKSIKLTKGLKQPIVIDKNNVVVCGHGRLLAAQKLGYDVVPCELVDDLTDDEIKAYRLIDNKIAEGDIDLDLLKAELDGITDIDMGEFDFDIEELNLDIEEQERQHELNKEATRRKVLNIVNLEKGQVIGVGDYDMPTLEPVTELPPIKEWIGFNYVLSDDNPEGKAVHFFIDDYQFERIWNNPEKYLDKLKQYVCVATPDFSPYGDMPHALQIYNHYRKQWVGAWLQAHGVTVIPTIRCSTDRRSLNWYLDGIPREGAVIISSMWTGDESISDISREEYTTMRDRLNPKKIFIYGGHSDNMGISDTDNVEYIKSFTQKRWGE